MSFKVRLLRCLVTLVPQPISVVHTPPHSHYCPTPSIQLHCFRIHCYPATTVHVSCLVEARSLIIRRLAHLCGQHLLHACPHACMHIPSVHSDLVSSSQGCHACNNVDLYLQWIYGCCKSPAPGVIHASFLSTMQSPALCEASCIMVEWVGPPVADVQSLSH